MCGPIQCIANNHSNDGLDSNSSVGLNSVQADEHDKGTTRTRATANCSVEPLGFTCGNPHLDEASSSLLYATNNVHRTSSKLTNASQQSMDTNQTHNTNALHAILTKSHHPSSTSTTATTTTTTTTTASQHPIVNHIHLLDKSNNFNNAKINNAKYSIHPDTSSIRDSSIDSSLPSQRPILLQQQQSRASRDNSSSTALKMRNKQSPSPLFGGTQVHLEKLLSRTKHHNNTNNGSILHSESETITTVDGMDASTVNAPTNHSSFKRKVQWGVSTGSGNNNKTIPAVLITANEDSTEVTNRVLIDRKKYTGNHHNLDIRPFASYHEEIVTALIDSALKGNPNHENQALNKDSTTAATRPNDPPTSNQEHISSADSTANSSPKRRSLTPIRKMRRNSPHRPSSLSTPLWKRNRSSVKLDPKIKHEQRSSEGSTGDFCEKIGMFHFKKHAASAPSVTSLEKKPLDYFHPKCRLLKEKGTDKRRAALDGKVPSAVGREAVLEKLQVSSSCLCLPNKIYNIYLIRVPSVLPPITICSYRKSYPCSEISNRENTAKPQKCCNPMLSPSPSKRAVQTLSKRNSSGGDTFETVVTEVARPSLGRIPILFKRIASSKSCLLPLPYKMRRKPW
jgi:hypothetical protein